MGGTLIRHGTFHATPFSRGVRADQNERLVAAITRPEGGPPVLVGADWNTECADRILVGQEWDLYEPADPYTGVDWFADLIYQCQWDYDERDGAGTGPTGGLGTCSGRAACTMPPRLPALTGRPRPAITRTTSTARTGCAAASTAFALLSRWPPRCAHTRCLTPRRPERPLITCR